MTDKTDREIMKIALEAIMDAMMVSGGISDKGFGAVKALQERLAQPEPRNQCGETCERAKLCAVCLAQMEKDPMQRFTDVQQEIEAALAQPEQEPVAVIKRNESGQIIMQTPDGNPFDMYKYIGAKLHTSPQQREWKVLTKEEMKTLADTHLVHQPESPEISGVFDLIRALEAKLKEKNT